MIDAVCRILCSSLRGGGLLFVHGTPVTYPIFAFLLTSYFKVNAEGKYTYHIKWVGYETSSDLENFVEEDDMVI